MRLRNISKIESIKKFYRYYTQDFTSKDLEDLFKKDAKEVYDFYVKRMKQPDHTGKRFTGKLIFIRNLFIEFLMQLTPGRRIIYSAAVIIFILSYLNNNWEWGVFSFLMINLLIAFELADKLTAKNELAVAREIQSGLMPKTAPECKHFEICGYSESAREVGGDYFDFICDENDPNQIYIVIGDISGKGMAAAIHMVQVRSILHNLVYNYNSPKPILISLNKNLRKVLRAGLFFTISLASLNSGKEIKLCRAGHLPLIYYSRKEDKCRNVIPAGMGMGLGSQHLFENTLEEISFEPDPGDILLFYTDGIIEAMNEYFMEFGEERLFKTVEDNAHKPVKLIQSAILNSVSVFTNSAPKNDDLTMIIIKAL